MANIDVNNLEDLKKVAFGFLSYSLLIHATNWHEFHNRLNDFAMSLADCNVTGSSQVNVAKSWISDNWNGLDNLNSNSDSSVSHADDIKYIYDVDLGGEAKVFVPDAFSPFPNVRGNAKPLARNAGSDSNWSRFKWHKYVNYWFSLYYQKKCSYYKKS